MKIQDLMSQSYDTLKTNRLRTVLSMLGIVLGVFSIVTILSISSSTDHFLNEQFEKLGSNSIVVRQTTKTVDISQDLSMEDGIELKRIIPQIKEVQSVSTFAGELILGENKRTANVYAVQPQFKNFNPLEIQNGRFINRNDEAFSNNVVVINDTLAKRIYNTTNVLGKKITIKNSFGSLLDFLIIGVYKNEGMDVESISGVEIPVDIFVPITSGQSFFSSRKVDFIQFSVDGNQDTLNRIGKRAIKALGFKHEIKDAFFASNSLEAKNQYLKVVGTITSILLVIAVITLVVGGIGIVNILLVSVSERYREIGIRKAVGADNSEIVLQFLVESTALTLIGGIIGIFFGFIGGSITSKIINIKFIYEIQIIVFSLLGVILLGVVFGVYPAYKASKLDPVETLRYE